MPREVVIPVSKAQLIQYADRIKANPALTLVEFVRNINGASSDFIIRPQIKNLQFNQGEIIDLGGADLSNSIWVDCIFSAEHITFRGKYWNKHLDCSTKLDTAEFRNCRFVGQDLSGVSLGQIEMSNKFFENCRLTHTKVDPTLSKIIRIIPTIEQLKQYVELRRKKPIPAAAQESFSDYLHNISKHRYPKNKVIIADLSNLVIDTREIGLTGKETDPEADFSRSDLRGAVLRGFKKITLRDCDLTGTLVEDCQFAKATDFRGSELGLMIIGRNCSFNNPKFSIPGDKAATIAQIEGSKRAARARSRECYIASAFRLTTAAITSLVTDVHPEHSVPAIRQAILRRLLPENFRSSMLVDGGEEIDFDPCYQRGSTSEMAKTSITYIKPQNGIADIYAYRDYCHRKDLIEKAKREFKAKNAGESPNSNYQWVQYLPNFAEFLKDKYKLRNANFVPDSDGLDFSGGFIRTKSKDDLTNCNFGRCNFGGALLQGLKFDGCYLQDSNFSGAVMSEVLEILPTIGRDATTGNLRIRTSNPTSFRNAYLANACFRSVNAEGVILDGANIDGLHAPDARLTGLSMRNTIGEYTNFIRSMLMNGQASAAILQRGGFAGSNMTGLRAVGADFSGSSFYRAIADRVDFTRSKLDHTDFAGAAVRNARFTEAKLQQARMAAIRTGAVMSGADATDMDISLAGFFNDSFEVEPAPLAKRSDAEILHHEANWQGCDLDKAVKSHAQTQANYSTIVRKNTNFLAMVISNFISAVGNILKFMGAGRAAQLCFGMANAARKVFNNPKLYLTCMAAIGVGLFILGTVATHGILPAVLVPLFITGTAICIIGGALVGGYYAAEAKPVKKLLGNQEEREIEAAAETMRKSEQEYIKAMDA